jgi:hypothetical protein
MDVPGFTKYKLTKTVKYENKYIKPANYHSLFS